MPQTINDKIITTVTTNDYLFLNYKECISHLDKMEVRHGHAKILSHSTRWTILSD
ncbi:hypothetical protein ACOMICROBIO_EPCKBFOG_01642 [Vibrio sp. B1FLJ16]|nr:hypothetical protein ACOMICROBIO_FLGHMIGD_01579 [Vibrio sp. B1FLJ16]CAD7807251.1 hypothetical protein ACOMICROBIO_EPCKBFOG_01642 [Vibrio sp. B1FLJ16]CAE6903089.1 hypothetical protein ACOMICROBIO_FLGHMIGD_01579 [Vibrio sp. B1FLJ16]CAE6905199.1 hypothetical protein ACOMICROBIO_EPCKBFOG_01642 [Vibrio sp. B1FLJ16]